MKKDILKYIKKYSENKNVQEILIKILGDMLLKQDNLENFIEKNNDKIIHIRDWISSVIENGEEWKKPRVLVLDALNNAADKYFEKKNQKIKTIELDETHEKLIADLGDYYVVQMLTSEALDNESKVMQHCIGHGGYDENLDNKNFAYLSLRDRFNKAHVTLEIVNNEIMQLQGKQNDFPEFKYSEKLFPWLMEKKYENIPWDKIKKYYDNEKWINFNDIKVIENEDYVIENFRSNKFDIINVLNEKTELYFCKIFENIDNIDGLIYVIAKDKKIIDIKDNIFGNCFGHNFKNIFQILFDNKYENIPFYLYNCILNKKDNMVYRVSDIPDNCEVDGILDFRFSENINLPKNLVVNKDLNLSFTKLKELPENLYIKNNLFLRALNIKELPESLKVGGDLDLGYSSIKTIPENFNVNGKLNLSYSEIQELPKGLKVKDLHLSYSKIEKLPDDLKIDRNLFLDGCNNITDLPNNIQINILSIIDSSLEELPDGLKCKEIWLSENQIIRLIKEDLDFQIIYIADYKKSYEKKEFFDKFAYTNLSFSGK